MTFEKEKLYFISKKKKDSVFIFNRESLKVKISFNDQVNKSTWFIIQIKIFYYFFFRLKTRYFIASIISFFLYFVFNR